MNKEGNLGSSTMEANTLNDLKSKVEEQVNSFRENLGYDLYDKLKIGLVVVICVSIIVLISYINNATSHVKNKSMLTYLLFSIK